MSAGRRCLVRERTWSSHFPPITPRSALLHSGEIEEKGSWGVGSTLLLWRDVSQPKQCKVCPLRGTQRRASRSGWMSHLWGLDDAWVETTGQSRHSSRQNIICHTEKYLPHYLESLQHSELNQLCLHRHYGPKVKAFNLLTSQKVDFNMDTGDVLLVVNVIRLKRIWLPSG